MFTVMNTSGKIKTTNSLQTAIEILSRMIYMPPSVTFEDVANALAEKGEFSLVYGFSEAWITAEQKNT